MDEGPGSLPAGVPRRRLGNFRTPELASSVRAVLAEAGIPSSSEPDPRRPERLGRLLDWLVRMAGTGGFLELTGTRTDDTGAVAGFAPPGDIHRVRNSGVGLGISLHIYGTDINRIGNSIRRTYDFPVRSAR